MTATAWLRLRLGCSLPLGIAHAWLTSLNSCSVSPPSSRPNTSAVVPPGEAAVPEAVLPAVLLLGASSAANRAIGSGGGSSNWGTASGNSLTRSPRQACVNRVAPARRVKPTLPAASQGKVLPNQANAQRTMQQR